MHVSQLPKQHGHEHYKVVRERRQAQGDAVAARDAATPLSSLNVLPCRHGCTQKTCGPAISLRIIGAQDTRRHAPQNRPQDPIKMVLMHSTHARHPRSSNRIDARRALKVVGLDRVSCARAPPPARRPSTCGQLLPVTEPEPAPAPFGPFLVTMALVRACSGPRARPRRSRHFSCSLALALALYTASASTRSRSRSRHLLVLRPGLGALATASQTRCCS